MLKNFSFVLLLVIAVCTQAQAKYSWEGVWEYGRYAPAYGGVMEIKNCRLNECNFSISTFHGAHTCNVDGKLRINDNKAVYYRYSQQNGDEDEQKIVMKLNPEKRIVNVDWQNGDLCGASGNLSGVYENKQNPLRHTTSYDCWANNLTEAEKTICASERLAKADREFTSGYPQNITYAWKKERNLCGADEECLWNFYTKAIYDEYKSTHDGNFSLYRYFQSQNPEWYFPTDYVLLQDYLMQTMPKPDYDAWNITLYDESDTQNCENCSFMTYGVTGLYKTYESAFYIDENGIWLAFVSANLPDTEQKNIVVYAPRGQEENNMPFRLKDWVFKMEKYYPEGVILKHLEKPKIKVINRNWYHKITGETYIDAPEPYAPTVTE